MAEAPRVPIVLALLLLVVHAPGPASAAVKAPCAYARLGDAPVVVMGGDDCPVRGVVYFIGPEGLPVHVDACVVDGAALAEVLRLVVSPECVVVPPLEEATEEGCRPEDPSDPESRIECCDALGCCTYGDADPVSATVCEVKRIVRTAVVAVIRQRIGQEGDDPWCLDVGQGPDNSVVLHYDPDHACTDPSGGMEVKDVPGLP